MNLPPLLHLATTTSTQEEAKARPDAPHGFVVVADVQTGGRGTRGRAWHSGPHGLWMSMVLRTALPLVHAPRLSLCVCDVVARELSCFVKWPNDLLVPIQKEQEEHPVLGPFRKAGGILVEAAEVDSACLRRCVVGIGVNLRVPDGGFPAEVRALAGSLDLDVSNVALATRLQALLVDVAGAAADDASFAAVRERLLARSATIGRRVRVDGVSGLAIGIAGDGALLIEQAGGDVVAVHSGDVVLG